MTKSGIIFVKKKLVFAYLQKKSYLCAQIRFKMMIHQLILSIMMSVMTITIESKSAVSLSGDVPAGVSATYENTYKKGQLTAGNSATLTMSGMEGMKIAAVQLNMHSNKAAGAGSLSLQIDGSLYWSIPNSSFSAMTWAGAFSSEDVPIRHEFLPWVTSQTGDMNMRVEASENSLFITSYLIEYQQDAPVPHMVSFVTSVGSAPAAVREPGVEQGVRLPYLDWQQQDWRFLGWTEAVVDEAAEAPAYHRAGEIYYPMHDCNLYALFSNIQEAGACYAVDHLDTGNYLITNVVLHSNSYGDVIEGLWRTEDQPHILQDVEQQGAPWVYDWETVRDDQTYQIDMLDDSHAVITNLASGLPVGYAIDKLATNDSVWTVAKRTDGTFDFCKQTGDTWYSIGVAVARDPVYGEEDVFFALQQDRNLPSAGLTLFPMDKLLHETLFSHYPMRYLPISDVQMDNQQTFEYQFGIYRLKIVNGKKYLELR